MGKTSVWEINGNLNSDKGLKNYQLFEDTLNEVFRWFCTHFGADVMQRYGLYVDNATEDSCSGHTPIITPILGEFLIIKLCINNQSPKRQIVYQFAHELTHLLCYSKLGIDKPFANNDEEAVCSAMSLIAVKELVGEEAFKILVNHVNKLEHPGYKNGLLYMRECNFDANKLHKKLLVILEQYKSEASNV